MITCYVLASTPSKGGLNEFGETPRLFRFHDTTHN